MNIAVSCGKMARGLSQVIPSWPRGKSSGRVISVASGGIDVRADLSHITQIDDEFALSGDVMCVTSWEGLPLNVTPSNLLAISDNFILASYKCHVKRSPILSSPNVL